ncbi:MAG: chitobiase/beta-hexosaminidase C-terminal domain-containing protein [Bacteroidales bacterium]|nr:chitobiase/beta-hexosaminidase C-terminal domain-containing protein [Bacteroidales bacterium]
MVKKINFLVTLMLVMLCSTAWAQTEVFKETFDKCKGTGGNDGVWGNIKSSSKVLSDNSGWKFSNGNSASKCVRLGTNSNQGKATTPPISLTGNGILTFKAGAWAKDATTLLISAKGASLDRSTVVMENSLFTVYNVNISNAKGNVTITFSGANPSKSRFFLDSVVVMQVNQTATTLTFAEGDKTFDVGGGNGTESFTNAATLSPAVEGASISYSSSNENVAIVDENGEVVVDTKNAGSATITANFAGNDQYLPSTASYTIMVRSGDGTVAKPYTIADLNALHDVNKLPKDSVCVRGIISQIKDFYPGSGEITYYISDDGTTTSQMPVYHGWGLNGYKFTAETDLSTGWTVTVKGLVKLDNDIVYVYNGNKILSIQKPANAAPTITGEKEFLETTVATITANQEGGTIYYTTDGTEPTDRSMKYTQPFTLSETATVKAISYLNGTASEIASRTFTKTKTLTVAEALNAAVGNEIVVKGIVARVDKFNSKYANVNYWISDDGSTTSELEIFRGTGLNNAKITSQDDIARGDVVIVRGTVDTYKNAKEIKNPELLSLKEFEEKATVGAAGWATYVTHRSVSFPQEVEAYTVEYDKTNDKITLNSVAAVPGMTAVVLKADQGEYALTKNADATAPTNNALTYSWADTTVATAKTIYVLAMNNGMIGFWPVKVGTTVAAFKGYLELNGSSAKDYFSLDEATGVKIITAETKENSVRYNLAGQRVDDNYKGVVIINCKKYIVK